MRTLDGWNGVGRARVGEVLLRAFEVLVREREVASQGGIRADEAAPTSSGEN